MKNLIFLSILFLSITSCMRDSAPAIECQECYILVKSNVDEAVKRCNRQPAPNYNNMYVVDSTNLGYLCDRQREYFENNVVSSERSNLCFGTWVKTEVIMICKNDERE